MDHKRKYHSKMKQGKIKVQKLIAEEFVTFIPGDRDRHD